MKLIVAVNNLNYIGKDGGMLWKCSADLKHFKNMTEHGTLIVGKTTFNGLPPLKNRVLLVVTNKPQNHVKLKEGETLTTRQVILEEALQMNPDWVIGGGQIYNQTVHLCDEIHISRINDDSVGDTRFEIPSDYAGKVFHYNFEPNT